MTADAKPSLPATEESPAETELRSRLARTIQLRATTQVGRTMRRHARVGDRETAGHCHFVVCGRMCEAMHPSPTV